MTVCPNCGNEVERPTKVLKNQFFSIEGYSCNACHRAFKKTK